MDLDDIMEVDTSFLDAYRTGAKNEPEPEEIEVADLSEEPPHKDPGEHGGSAAAEQSGTEQIAEPGGVEEALDEDVPDAVSDGPVSRHDLDEEATEALVVAFEHTDEQDAIQAAAARGGDESSTAELVHTPFRLGDGSAGQPQIRLMPKALVSAMRDLLSAAAVRELGVDEAEAVAFAKRLSQPSLVVAYLLAGLDVELPVDPATRRAAALFRSRDPLLGRVATRLDGLIGHEARQAEELSAVRSGLDEVRRIGDVLEHLLSYSVADRAENLGRHTTGVGDLELGHRHVIRLRDRAREAARRQGQLEAQSAGRRMK